MNKYSRTALLAALAALALISAAMAGSRSIAWLGVVSQDVDRNLAEEFSLKSPDGAIIDEVVKDSPADKAGLKEDDIIIAFNDDKVRDSKDLTDLIHDSEPGDAVNLTVIRHGVEQKIAVELGKQSRSRGWFDRWNWTDVPSMPDVPAVPDIPSVPRSPHLYSYYQGERPYIGVTLVELSEEAAQALGGEKGGVLVDEVEEGSPAETAGVKAGDLIVAIDKEQVFNSSDVQEIIRDLDKGDTVRLSLIRDRKPLELRVKVELDEGPSFYGNRGVIRIPDLPDIELDRGHFQHYNRDRQDYSEQSEQYREEMRALQRDLEKMRKELEEMKKSLH